MPRYRGDETMSRFYAVDGDFGRGGGEYLDGIFVLPGSERLGIENVAWVEARGSAKQREWRLTLKRVTIGAFVGALAGSVGLQLHPVLELLHVFTGHALLLPFAGLGALLGYLAGTSR